MAINPELITTIRVDQLPDETLSLTNLFPHTVGTDLKSATIQELVDLVATAIGVSGGVGYIAISVTDGQQLPDVPELPSFFLCGAGTYLNINGYPDVICTENLNAVMSLTDHWELAVEIPINPLSGTVQSVTGSAVDNTDPLNPVINSTGGVGSQTLSDTLDNGNQTGGTDISISDGDKIVLDNGANLKKGTTDAGLGGSKGIALRCAVDYELKWEAGRLYVMGGDGFTIREVSHNFTTTPTATDDDDKGFVIDSRWILDNGNVYVCTDATTGAAVWELQDFGTTPTLQQVTAAGNETTNDIIVKDSENKVSLGYRNIVFQDLNLGGDTALRFESTSEIAQEVFIRGLGGTMALTSDITTPTLQEVLDEGDSAEDSAIFLSNTANDFETSINEFGDGQIVLKSVVNDTLTNIGASAVYLGTIDGSDNVIINKDGISVNSVNYAFPSGASSPLATLDDITGSGVTSVGLTMPSAFSVTNSPITSSGDIAVTGAGLVSQYVRGDGTLANFPNSTGGGSSVNYYLNGSVSQGTFGGDTFYEMSKTPILGAGTNFTRTNGAGNGYIASFITDAGDPSFLNIPGGNWNLEFYFQSSATGGSPQFYGEIYKVSATDVFTLVASGSANPEGITNGTTIDQYFTSISVPQTSLLITDRLAIRIYVITSGRTITLHTENGNLCEVLTTFTTGLTALNGLTTQVQNLAVGTSGTDFAISSSTDTHTFNLPTASASNRGALSSTDWTTFNNKQNALGFTAENVANKENTTLDTSTSKYPTNRLVKEYADAKVADSITDGVTTIAPSQNAVFDALALKQNSLSYTPYRFVQTSQTAHTGTTAETILATATIAGGTFNSSDVMKVIWQLIRPSGGSSGATIRVRINTSNTLTGATSIAQNTLTTFPFQGTGIRTFTLQGGNLIGYPIQNAFTDFSSNNFTALNTTYNTANTLYVFFTLTLVSSSDSVTLTLANITN